MRVHGRPARSLDLNPGGISYVGATFAGAKGDYLRRQLGQIRTYKERYEDFSRLMLTQMVTLGHTA